MFRPTRREMIIALFTGFFVTYWVLTSSARRSGARARTRWPWNLPLTHH